MDLSCYRQYQSQFTGRCANEDVGYSMRVECEISYRLEREIQHFFFLRVGKPLQRFKTVRPMTIRNELRTLFHLPEPFLGVEQVEKKRR